MGIHIQALKDNQQYVITEKRAGYVAKTEVSFSTYHAEETTDRSKVELIGVALKRCAETPLKIREFSTEMPEPTHPANMNEIHVVSTYWDDIKSHLPALRDHIIDGDRFHDTRPNSSHDIACRVQEALSQLDKPDLTAEELQWRAALEWAATGEPVGFGMRKLNTTICKAARS